MEFWLNLVVRNRSTFKSSRFIALAAGVALLAAAGCQTTAMETERTLAAAGFQMKMADTPQRLAKIESLPQRKLTRVPFQGENRFVYADAKYCKCLYAGTEEAYDRYQNIAIKKVIAEEQMDASMNSDGWGPWY